MQEAEIDLQRVLPPHLVGTGTTGGVEKVGRRQVYLVGAGAAQEKGKVYSGDYVCGTAQFQRIVDKAVIATQGICSVQITDNIQEVDTTVKLWMVVQATMEGHNQEVVVSPHGVTARGRETRPVDHQGWWHALCHQLQWGKGATGYTQEVVRIRTKQYEDHRRLHVWVQWRHNVPPQPRYRAHAWSAMRVPEGMHANELHTGIMTANLQGINQKGDEMDHTKWDQLTQVIETT